MIFNRKNSTKLICKDDMRRTIKNFPVEYILAMYLVSHKTELMDDNNVLMFCSIAAKEMHF